MDAAFLMAAATTWGQGASQRAQLANYFMSVQKDQKKPQKIPKKSLKIQGNVTTIIIFDQKEVTMGRRKVAGFSRKILPC